MSRPFVRALAVLALVQGLVAAAQGPGALDDRAERERIARERSEATARHDQRRRECEQRFAVTACVDEARAEHRQTMIRLRRQEALLDEGQRKARAAQRLAAIEQKRGEERARIVVPRAGAQATTPEPRPPRGAASSAERASTPAVPAAASAADRRAAEARSRARFDAQQRDAAARRDAAQQKRIQREKSGKPPSAPLPDPAAP
jgi:colicin import membrane protein